MVKNLGDRTDLSGRAFGKWTVLRFDEVKKTHRYWWCRCECGKESSVMGSKLFSGKSLSCGGCNTYRLEDDHMVCVTKSGKTFKFDKSDFRLVRRYVWHIHKHGYAQTEINGVSVPLHRMLLLNLIPENGEVDHINLDRSDNRRSNLRPATRAQNMQNRGVLKSNTSGYKGVSWHKRIKKFCAYICVNSRLKNLGYYEMAEDAARAYNTAAKYYYGEYARINKIYENGGNNND